MIKKKPIKRSEWFNNASANFIGTLLGIIITFGTSSYIEHINKDKKYKQIITATLLNINRLSSQLNDQTEILNYEDSLFTYVFERFPNCINLIGNDTLTSFINQMGYRKFAALDKTAENMLNNIEALNDIDDLKLLYLLGDCYAGYHKCEDIINTIYNRKTDLFMQFSEVYSFKDFSTPAQTVEKMLNFPSIYNYFRSNEHYNNYKTLSSLIKNVDSLLEIAEDRAQINENDVRKLLDIPDYVDLSDDNE